MQHELVAKWRREAELAESELGETDLFSRDESDLIAQKVILQRCANELENYHHHDAHNAAWEPGCPLCATEMKEAGLEPL